MDKAFIYIILIFSWKLSLGQFNLVPNGSFEDTVYCPMGTANFQAVAGWYSANLASPDYYNSCDTQHGSGVPNNDWGFQYAQDGNAYAGIITIFFDANLSIYREYIQIQLSETLKKDSLYCWSLYVSRLDNVDYASNNFGLALSDTEVTEPHQSLLPLVPFYNHPQIIVDDENWLFLNGTYQANGGEKYLTLGNFFDDSNTNTLQVGNGLSGGTGAYFYVDNVWFGACEASLTFPNIFTPNGDGANDFFLPLSQNIKDYRLYIYNRWGFEVFTTTSVTQSWDGTYMNRPCADGVYYYVCNYSKGTYKKEITKGFIQLVR